MSDEERDDSNGQNLPSAGDLLRWAEKTQRTIDFMVQQQAQFQAKSETDMQRLRELYEQNEARGAQNEERWASADEGGGRADERRRGGQQLRGGGSARENKSSPSSRLRRFMTQRITNSGGRRRNPRRGRTPSLRRPASVLTRW